MPGAQCCLPTLPEEGRGPPHSVGLVPPEGSCIGRGETAGGVAAAHGLKTRPGHVPAIISAQTHVLSSWA